MRRTHLLSALALVLAATSLPAAPVHAADWFVAPLGAPTGTNPAGTETDPFKSIDAAFSSGKVNGGDRVLLKDGEYGAIDIRSRSFTKEVTIRAQHRRLAHLESLLVRFGSSNLKFINLAVWPSNPDSAPKSWLVEADTTTSDIKILGFDIRSEKNAANFLAWNAAKWNTRSFSGISLGGPRSIAGRNALTAIYGGITLYGNNSRASRNTINGFNGDGMRGLGDNNVFRYNHVLNCVSTDDNHDDGFQSFAGSSGVVKGLVLDSNVIINWTGAPGNPLRCELQGVGLFDGFYDDLTIVNNVVSALHYHGISVYGARGARILNNTVVNSEGNPGTAPWILVTDHKNGTPSRDVVVANNIAMSFKGESSVPLNVVFRDNSVVGVPLNVFVDPLHFDYRPKAASSFVDTGVPMTWPHRDIVGEHRPAGPAPDRGAFEVVDGGGGPSKLVLVEDPEALMLGANENGDDADTPPPTKPVGPRVKAKTQADGSVPSPAAAGGAKWVRTP